jgi:hypothetical protein
MDALRSAALLTVVVAFGCWLIDLGNNNRRPRS